MKQEEFEQYVSEGIETLPAWVREMLQNVAFIIEDEPSEEQRYQHGLLPGDTLFGLYQGTPMLFRGDDAPIMPDMITIFREPILETYHKKADIRECINNTIWHEVGHYLGYDEEWIEREEERRGMMK